VVPNSNCCNVVGGATNGDVASAKSVSSVYTYFLLVALPMDMGRGSVPPSPLLRSCDWIDCVEGGSSSFWDDMIDGSSFAVFLKALLAFTSNLNIF
jgi:hypothetical protein